ncbi:MAG: glucose-6-phosphate dehydrogenase [Spirochaetota bacterium]
MERVDDHILIIFGASGDLTERKLVPALFDLFAKRLLPARFAVLGVGRSPLTTASFREKMARALTNAGADARASFLPLLNYISMNTEDIAAYGALADELTRLSTTVRIDCNYIFYLAVPPSLSRIAARGLADAKLNRDCREGAWKRIVVEKPFGRDLASARELDLELKEHFREDQIYRIDHYLGKETVQNILVTRFGNTIYEPVWNRNFIERVEITSAEDIGVEDRGGYYEESGALRDMVQNHLLQVASFVAMEPPARADASSIRNETIKVFRSLRPITGTDVSASVVRGQYTASMIAGKRVLGYREEKGVAPDSRTETFAALKFFIDNWRWQSVPFYLRTGKRLPTRVTEVAVHFKSAPLALFPKAATGMHAGNQLIMRIQPDEGLLVKYNMKTPGDGFAMQTVNMDFHYSDLANVDVSSAYERLLLDVMQGDATLYLRGDAVEATWEFIDPILSAFAKDPTKKIFGYPAGSWGPKAAEELIAPNEWRYPCKNLAEDGEVCEL